MHFVPTVIDSSSGGERAFDIYSRLLRDRIIFINGPIDDHVAGLVNAQLLFLQSLSKDSIISIYINSPGGSVTSALSMYDTIRFVSCPVSTVCMGLAASAGSLLLASGDEGYRYSLPHSRIMLHQPSGGAYGQATDIEIHAKEILFLRKELNNIYKSHLKCSIEEIELIMERDFFIGPEKALELGIIDKILPTKKLSKQDNESK